MLPSDGRKHFFKKMQSYEGEGGVDKGTTNGRGHAKFTRLQVRCIQYVLLIGLWGLKMHKSPARVINLVGSRSEEKRNRTNK